MESKMQIPARKKIRTRRVGSNTLSDKYTAPTRVEDTFRDLALFIAHTGFANVRHKQKLSDVGILPIFRSMGELHHFLRHVVSIDEITCGFTFHSLDMAWQIFQQDMVSEGNTLWYIMDELRFILYIRCDISKSTFGVLIDQDTDETLGPMHTTFRSCPIELSIDSFISTQIMQQVQTSTIIAGIPIQQLCREGRIPSSAHIHNAISIMYPRYLKIHRISRSSIAKRLSKCRHAIQKSLDGPTI